jgi:hypothetical protein
VLTATRSSGTGFFGFVQYLVSAFDLMLHNGATWIEIDVGDNISLSSDAKISIKLNASGVLEPFEIFGALKSTLKSSLSPDAAILTALSKHFYLTIDDGVTETTLVYEQGERKSLRQQPSSKSQPPINVVFSPDYPAIFSVRAVSPTVLHSYCRRTACLFPGVVFRVKISGEETEYKSEQGIRDFFTAIATPYQLLHKPIHVYESESDLTVELIFVFHSWSESRI